MSSGLPLKDIAQYSWRVAKGPLPDYGYSITSSARSRRDVGRSSPGVLAVLRLIANSNLVGCSLCGCRYKTQQRPTVGLVLVPSVAE